MKYFKDTNGRDWPVVISVETIRRVRALVNVDLLDVVNGELLDRLSNDPVLFVDVLFAICKPDADKGGVTSEAFGSALAGDVIDRATTAFLGELTDFFPSGKRQLLAQILTKTSAINAKVLEIGLLEVQKIDEDSLIRKALSASSGSLPASLESTLAPSPSASSTG